MKNAQKGVIVWLNDATSSMTGTAIYMHCHYFEIMQGSTSSVNGAEIKSKLQDMGSESVQRVSQALYKTSFAKMSDITETNVGVIDDQKPKK